MKSRVIPMIDRRAQRRLIREASRREVDGDGFRERMDDWLNTFQLKIKWAHPVDIYEEGHGVSL